MKKAQLVELESNGNTAVMVFGKTYDIKDALKAKGYRFTNAGPFPHWVRDLGSASPEQAVLDSEKSFLAGLGVQIG